MFLTSIRHERCVKKHLEKTLLLWGMFPSGLLCGSGYVCDMMKVTIGLMMKIIFLSGMKAIKNGRPEKQK